MNKANPFPNLMRAFFYEWLVEQRNASVHTVRSYRDTWRLFLRFVAQRAKKTVAMITLADLTATDVAAFLRHTEQERGGTIGTRNCRLAAIRSFFNFVATRDPASIAQCVEILNVPVKRAPVSEPCYLEPAEVAAILAQPDRSTVEGMRDHALLSFLYNSGARIQEALDLCPEMIRFESPSCVRLIGKGRKERICPLWPETALLLKKLLERQPRDLNKPLFVNRYGEPLSASGVRFKLAGYEKAAAETEPSLHSKHVTPHSFRHDPRLHIIRPAPIPTWPLHHLASSAKAFTTIRHQTLQSKTLEDHPKPITGPEPVKSMGPKRRIRNTGDRAWKYGRR